ncbi:thaumatin [Rhizoctonia solani]|nr:thaumatin [Rhizoctonia solani]
MKSTALFAFAGSVLGGTFTVYNACPYTIWPAIFTDLNVGTSVPAIETGWEAPASSKRTFTVPDNWKAGRIWGRTGCDFSNETSVGPVSVAEWTLGASDDHDWYDVSLVDGFNLLMRISNNVGCQVSECAVDLDPGRPDVLKGPLNTNGTAAGCKSACLANLNGNPTNSRNCCTGNYNTPMNCPPSGVQYYSYFKNRCPTPFAYTYNESSRGPVSQGCITSMKADYTLTFCP